MSQSSGGELSQWAISVVIWGAQAVGAFFVTLVSLLTKRAVRKYDDAQTEHLKSFALLRGRVETLERGSVTRSDLDRTMRELADQARREREELREDRRRMHDENKEALREFRDVTEQRLERIESKADATEDLNREERHALRDDLHALGLKVAELAPKN